MTRKDFDIRASLGPKLCAVLFGALFFGAYGLAQTAPPTQASAPAQPNTSAQTSTIAQTNPTTQPQRRPDSVVAADVSKKLMASDTLRPLGLGIWVHNGTATLTGTVPTQELRKQAEDMVKSVDGIHTVDDKIVIGSRPETAPGASASSNAGEPSPSGYAPQVQPNRVTLPIGTPVYVMIMRPIDSRHTKPGDSFRGVLMQNIVNRNGVIAVPRGADVIGTVIDARGPGHLKGRPHLALQLTGLDIANARYPLISNVWARGGPGKGGQSTATIGGSAAVGAIVGGAVGGGGTALLGGLLGGLGGAGLSALSSGPQLFVPAESVLTFYLNAPLTVQTPTTGEIQMLSSRVPPPANRYGSGYGRRGYYGPGYPPPPPGYYRQPGYYPPPPPPGGPPGGYPY